MTTSLLETMIAFAREQGDRLDCFMLGKASMARLDKDVAEHRGVAVMDHAHRSRHRELMGVPIVASRTCRPDKIEALIHGPDGEPIIGELVTIGQLEEMLQDELDDLGIAP